MAKEARRMEKQAKLAEEKQAKQHRVRQDLAGDVANYTGGANAQCSSTKQYARIAGNRDTSRAIATAARSTRPPSASAAAKQDMRRGTAQKKQRCASDARYWDTLSKYVATHRVMYHKTNIYQGIRSKQPRQERKLDPCAAKFVDQTICTSTNGYAKDVVDWSSTTRTVAPNAQVALPQEEKKMGQTKQPRNPKVSYPR